MSGIGTAVINFGAHPGASEASVIVSGQTEITAASVAEAYWMADDTTSDHTASDHRYAAAMIGLTCGTPVAATGFTIYARALDKLVGTFTIRWVWAD
jgi:hypothetical protein